MGNRVAGPSTSGRSIRISIHAPHTGGATKMGNEISTHTGISIHVPHTGERLAAASARHFLRKYHFHPHSPYGKRLCTTGRCCKKSAFHPYPFGSGRYVLINPINLNLLLTRRAAAHERGVEAQSAISIHASHAGATRKYVPIPYFHPIIP